MPDKHSTVQDVIRHVEHLQHLSFQLALSRTDCISLYTESVTVPAISATE